MLRHLVLVFLLLASGATVWLIVQSSASDPGPGPSGEVGSGAERAGASGGQAADRPRTRPRGDRDRRGHVEADGPESTADAADRDEPVVPERGEPGTILEAAVVTPSGTPLGAAVVRLYRQRETGVVVGDRVLIRDPAITGQDGEFRFDELEGGRGYALAVEHGAYAAFELQGIEVRKGEITRLPDIRLSGGATILGSVIRKGSQDGIAGALVAARSLARRSPGSDPPIVKQVIADEDGFFRLANLAPGPYDLLVSARGYATRSSSAIHVNAPNEEHRVTVALGRGHRIQGVVREVGGSPVSGALVRAFPSQPSTAVAIETTTRKSGSFLLDGLSEGEYRLVASAKGYVDAEQKGVESGAKGIQLTLAPSVGITGYVVDADTGKPLKNFGIQVWAVGKNDQPSHLVKGSMLTFRSEDGSYTVDELVPGRYAVKAFHNDFRPTRSPSFDILRVYVHGVTIEMEKGATIRGTVVDSRGDPIARARVTLLSNAYRETPLSDMLYGKEARMGGTRTDDEGAFILENVEAGVYQIKLESEGLRTTYHRDIAVADKEDVDLGPLAMTEGGHLLVAVIDARGVPARGARVLVRASDGTQKQAQVNKDGEALFANLPPGACHVSVFHTGGASAGNILAAGIEAARNEREIQIAEGVRVKEIFDVP